MNIVVNEYQDNVRSKELVKDLFECYAKRLVAYTRKNYPVNEDDAWTLVYKTIYRIADVYDRYSFGSKQKQTAFVFKTHINYLKNYFRDNKSFEAKNQEVPLDEDVLPEKQEAAPNENLYLLLLQEELDKLQEWERVLLLMRGQEIPYSQIAEFVNKPERHLKVYYARLKKQLLERLNAVLQKTEPTHGKK